MLALIASLILFQAPQQADKWPGIPAGFTQDERSALEKYVQADGVRRALRISALRSRLKGLKKNVPVSGPARKVRLEEIKSADRDLKLLEAGVTFPSAGDLRLNNLNKGDVGYLGPTATVRQVIDRDVELRVDYMGDAYSVILEDIPVDNIADGERFVVPFVLECVGAKQFKTVTGGTRSLYVFRKFPYTSKLKEWEDLRIAAWENARKK